MQGRALGITFLAKVIIMTFQTSESSSNDRRQIASITIKSIMLIFQCVQTNRFIVQRRMIGECKTLIATHRNFKLIKCMTSIVIRVDGAITMRTEIVIAASSTLVANTEDGFITSVAKDMRMKTAVDIGTHAGWPSVMTGRCKRAPGGEFAYMSELGCDRRDVD